MSVADTSEYEGAFGALVRQSPPSLCGKAWKLGYFYISGS